MAMLPALGAGAWESKMGGLSIMIECGFRAGNNHRQSRLKLEDCGGCGRSAAARRQVGIHFKEARCDIRDTMQSRHACTGNFTLPLRRASRGAQ